MTACVTKYMTYSTASQSLRKSGQFLLEKKVIVNLTQHPAVAIPS